MVFFLAGSKATKPHGLGLLAPIIRPGAASPSLGKAQVTAPQVTTHGRPTHGTRWSTWHTAHRERILEKPPGPRLPPPLPSYELPSLRCSLCPQMGEGRGGPDGRQRPVSGAPLRGTRREEEERGQRRHPVSRRPVSPCDDIKQGLADVGAAGVPQHGAPGSLPRSAHHRERSGRKQAPARWACLRKASSWIILSPNFKYPVLGPP